VIIYLCRQFLGYELSLRPEIIRAEKASPLPTVLSKLETLAIIGNMQGVPKLIVQLLYGSCLRFMECMRLRVKDLE
jgi:hypothetical protein